jgi:hypothetical protein
MRTTFLSVLVLIASLTGYGQTINPDIYKQNISALYDAAKAGFKSIKLESAGESAAGNKKYLSAKKVSGAAEVYLDVDTEDSHTYYALFKSTDKETADKMLEEMIVLAAEIVADKGLVRKKGTEMRYEGYRKHTLEYDSDNIDLMGKYPSFEFGIIKGSSPIMIEMRINEPLWK